MSIFFNQISRSVMPAIRRTAKTVQRPIVRSSSGRAARHPVNIVNLSDGLINKFSRPNNISSNERRILKAHTAYQFPKAYFKNNAGYFEDLKSRNPDSLTLAQRYDVLIYQVSKQGGALKQQARQTARQFRSGFQDMTTNTRNLWHVLQTPQDRRALWSPNILSRMPKLPVRPASPPKTAMPALQWRPTGAPPWAAQKRPADSFSWTPQGMPNAKRARTQPPAPSFPSASTGAPPSPFHTQNGKKAVTSGVTSPIAASTPKRPPENNSPFNVKRQRTTADPPFTLQTPLENITFQQQNGYSCYLLAGLDGILHHPQGKQILNRIQVQPVADGYMVKLPTQQNAIHVTKADLNHPETVKASHEIIPILERAYMKLPGVEPGKYDNVQAATERMFGKSSTGNLDVRTLEESLAQSGKPGGPVKIWTAMKNHAPSEGVKNTLGEHYYSVRLNNAKPGYVTVSNPFTPGKPETMPLSEFQKTFVAEYAEIPAG